MQEREREQGEREKERETEILLTPASHYFLNTLSTVRASPCPTYSQGVSGRDNSGHVCQEAEISRDCLRGSLAGAQEGPGKSLLVPDLIVASVTQARLILNKVKNDRHAGAKPFCDRAGCEPRSPSAEYRLIRVQTEVGC